MQNDWKTRDLGRPPGRSDGRKKLATWPASPALELAANRRVRFVLHNASCLEQLLVEHPHHDNTHQTAWISVGQL